MSRWREHNNNLTPRVNRYLSFVSTYKRPRLGLNVHPVVLTRWCDQFHFIVLQYLRKHHFVPVASDMWLPGSKILWNKVLEVNLLLAKPDILDGTPSSDLLVGGRVLSEITRSLEVIFDVENVFFKKESRCLGLWNGWNSSMSYRIKLCTICLCVRTQNS